MSNLTYKVLPFLLLMAGSRVLFAVDLESVDLPILEPIPGVQGQWISEKMAVNGLPMSIYGFATTSTADEVLGHYDRLWRSHGLTPSRQSFDGGIILATADKHYHYSVQATERSSQIEALLVVSSRPDQAVVDTSTRLPLPRSIRILGKYQYLDKGLGAESLSIESAGSADDVFRAIERKLDRAGWSQILAERLGGDIHGWVAEYQRNAEHVQAQLVDVRNARGMRGIIHWRY